MQVIVNVKLLQLTHLHLAEQRRFIIKYTLRDKKTQNKTGKPACVKYKIYQICLSKQ